MKNIHRINGNIYITSYEEIKEGDWTLMFDDFGNLFLCDKPQQYLGIEKGHHLNKGLKKIILTTDPRLAPNGVQSIDNEFLEWFVKNPNCESVDVESMFNMVQFTSREFIYKIIIPKEQQMYSEEDMLVFSKFCQEDEHECRSVNLSLLKDWFEQFKKK